MTEKNRAGKGHPDDAALQEKRRLAGEIIERLEKEYPDAGCTLDYDDAWKLLVSVRLAAQCTDARVNVVVEKLYEKFPDVKPSQRLTRRRLRNWCVRADLEKVRRGISVLVCGCSAMNTVGKYRMIFMHF